MFKKFTSGLLAVVILAALLLGLPGCNGGDSKGFFSNLINGRDETVAVTGANYSKEYKTGTWAVYWYLCGTDLESKGGMASADLQEMLQVKLPQNVTVVIETGGTKVWQNNMFDAGKRERYIYAEGDLKKVDSLPLASMGDPNTFAEFLFYCNDNYPAEKQMLLLWDHGGGSLSGMEVDELHDKDVLSLPEFREAIKAMPAASGAYEVVGFDACLMATVEIAEILRGSARYMVASEEVEPGIGWDYTGMFAALAADTKMGGAALGTAICDSYFAACKKNLISAETTLSVVDLNKAGPLLAACKAVGDEALLLAIEQKQPYLSSFGRAARDAEGYGGGGFEMVDLGDLVRLAGGLLPQNGQTLLNALDDCVVYKVQGKYRPNASGLSCYYNLSGNPASTAMYQALEINKPYAFFHEYAVRGALSEAAQAYLAQQTEEPAPGPAPLPPANDLAAALNGFPVSVGADGYWHMNLGPKLASNLAGVFVNLVWVEPESDLNGWYGMSRSDLSADYENGVFVENFNSTTGSIGEGANDGRDDCPIYMEPIGMDAGYVLFASPIMLNGERHTLHIGYTIATGEYELIGAWGDGEDRVKGMASKSLHTLEVGDVIEPVMFLLPLHDDGTRSVEDMPLGEVIVTENTRFREKHLSGGYYSLTFEMVDYAGNQYTSAPAFFRVREGVVERLPGGIKPAASEAPEGSIPGYNIELGSFYHEGRDENIPFYTIAIPETYSALVGELGLPNGNGGDSNGEGYTIQIYSDTIDLAPYVGMKKVYFYGTCFEGSTIYHRRDIVCNVTKVIEVW